MKNLHLLSTEKPSRLHFDSELFITPKIQLSKDINSIVEGRNIYITSDEEIKDGYAFYLKTQEVLKVKGVGEKSKEIFHSKGFSYQNDCKKIILTTDQDLIKDGVQAIDDEFLEWFVNNSSCEEVMLWRFHGINTSIAEVNAISGDGSLNWQGRSDLRDYKIIIPQEEATIEDEYLKDELKKYDGIDVVVLNKTEEPKQEGYICPHTKLQCDDECCVSAEDCHIKASIGIISEPKQETLEEVARNYRDLKLPDDLYDGFIAGAKWQQEQDKNKYSEEEVDRILRNFRTDFLPLGQINDLTLNNWFNKFKKK